MIQHTMKNLSALFLDGNHQVERIMWENYVHINWVEPWNWPNVITDNADQAIVNIYIPSGYPEFCYNENLRLLVPS